MLCFCFNACLVHLVFIAYNIVDYIEFEVTCYQCAFQVVECV